MSRIDRIRLTEIFKTLSSSSKNTGELQRSKLDSRGPVVDGSKLAGRDYAVLKEQIKNRLKLIDQASDDYLQVASVVAVHEVLLWEFGESVMDDPDFRNITNRIIQGLESHPVLSENLRHTISSLLE